jgi:hypothetical protein
LSGHGANWWVRRAGYNLPDWYHQHDAANNVEAINKVIGGESHAIDVFNSWLGSPAHRAQVLGETDFYRAQIAIGVGMAKTVEDGKPVHYWIWLSAHAEED